jgi:mRNA-degrading endonuclease RelE of RelBE toxin-antitoxin system
MTLKIIDTPTFRRVIKKLHTRDKKVVDSAVLTIAGNPKAGEEKKGDLAGVFVYKFKINKQEVLLAYMLQPDKYKPKELVLLNLGSHENFYGELKR